MFISLLQAITILSFAPLIVLLSGSEFNLQSSLLNSLFNTINFKNNAEIIILIVSILFISSNFLNILINKFNFDLCNKIGARIGNQYFVNIINNEELINLNKKNYEIVNTLNTEVTRVTNGIILPIINILSKFLNVLIIFTGLVFINIFIAIISLIILSFIYFFILFIFKKKFKKNSKEISTNSANRQKIISESIYNIRETKVFEIEKYFIKLFENFNINYSKSIASNQFLTIIPKNLVEITIFSFVIYFIFILYSKNQLINYLPILGVYLVGFYKMLPAIQNMATSYSSLKGNITALDEVMSDLSVIKKKKIDNEKIFLNYNKNINSICIKNLSHSFQSKKVFINTSINLTKGSLIGICGETGSGKTTFLDFLCGITRLDSFNTIIDGIEIKNMKNIRNTISISGQNPLIMNETIYTNITLGREASDFNLNEVIKIAEINFIDNIKDGLNTIIGEKNLKLSSGQIQRIAIARALYKKFQILLMDEPTNNLDNKIEKKIFANLKKIKKEKIIIIVSHSKNIDEFLDYKYELKDGLFNKIF
ncbi:ABC transporter ATP-binding protein/permease [Pelagibacteraceae bacterium]|nr:ABC transporter ATP-binding protein/permease [Pelagibacteraceae bacterium]